MAEELSKNFETLQLHAGKLLPHFKYPFADSDF
jgi:hypothetical protein